MTRPFASCALLMLNVANIIEVEMNRELSASFLPGHTLSNVESTRSIEVFFRTLMTAVDGYLPSSKTKH